MSRPSASTADAWPPLPLAQWTDSRAALHLWTQIVGKVRLTQGPWINHSWGVTLYLTARGLTTGPIPHGWRVFQLDFDFLAHRLEILTSGGERAAIALAPRTVANFHAELMATLDRLEVPVRIDPMPNELEAAVPFHLDDTPRPYDGEAVERFWRVLLQADRVLRRFRSRFVGKCSPVHFFWGSFDLAVTRFSGRAAPLQSSAPPNLPLAIAQEAYNRECASAGFWPGTPGGPVDEAAFYAYAYPNPTGFEAAAVAPDAAYWQPDLGEFVLPWEAVRESRDPESALLSFLQSSYEAAADLGRWDRRELEREEGRP